ncbi:MAG: DUF3037 domain-containing protein [Nitrosopumilus sp.]|nr:DUF3037 domain-containing protein [Nitrosopumilus sp.]
MGSKQLFRYAVIRYVPDHIRDEATNLGIVLSPAGGGISTMKMVSHGTLRRICKEGRGQAEMLEMVASNIAAECRKGVPMERMVKKYIQRIRLSESLPTMADDPVEEVEDLFKRFVSIKDVASNKGPVLRPIRNHVWNAIRAGGGRKNVEVAGRRGTSKFDFIHTNGSARLVHFVHIRGRQSLRAVRLFDWYASDVIDGGRYRAESFVPVLVCEGGNSPADEGLAASVGEAAMILERYDVRHLDTKGWRDGIRGILA